MTPKEMQNKDLINKLYRPIEPSNTTSRTPHSTPSKSATPPAEENHPSQLMVLLISLSRLETKLCRKNMAMKSNFIDELWSLKQEAPITKKRDYNQDETTALKNRIKQLELENRLLKCGNWNSRVKKPSWKNELRIMTSLNRVKSNCDVIANFS